jgi:hypothetical protein
MSIQRFTETYNGPMSFDILRPLDTFGEKSFLNKPEYSWITEETVYAHLRIEKLILAYAHFSIPGAIFLWVVWIPGKN